MYPKRLFVSSSGNQNHPIFALNIVYHVGFINTSFSNI